MSISMNSMVKQRVCALVNIFLRIKVNLIVGNCARVMKVKPGSMGRAIPGHLVDVVDEEGNILPPGKVGVVAARPDPVTFLHYLNNTEATKKKFTPNGWLKTGDSMIFFLTI